MGYEYRIFLLGLASIVEGWLFLRTYVFHNIIFTIFGAGLVFTALFQHAPIVEGMAYNIREDEIHSLLATVVGFSFTSFAVSAAFIEGTNRRRILALLVGFVSTGLSILMFSVPDYAGVWQRFIFIISFAWLVFFFEGMRPSYKHWDRRTF